MPNPPHQRVDAPRSKRRRGARAAAITLAASAGLALAVAAGTGHGDGPRTAATVAGAGDVRPAAAAKAKDPVQDARALATRGLRGANNWSCRPTAAHPAPVVLVHGMLSTGSVWSSLSPQLQSRGHCVFALDYSATIPVDRGVEQLSVFIDGVLAATRAGRVTLVGHSLGGGMVPHGYLARGGGKVTELVGIAPANQGQRIRDGVDYTVVASQYDGVVGTPRQQFLDGPAERVTNVRLQDKCPANRATHVTMIFDRTVFQWVFNALDRTGPADPGLRPRC